jgi:NTP pyrophosphatase (non-canonical NTP hydrolase)
MTPDQFVLDAIRTESKIKTIDLNHNFVVDLIAIIINLGTILDQVKKNTFYKKPFDIGKVSKLLRESVINIDGLINDVENGDFSNETAKRNHVVNTRLFHSIVGLTTEAIELLEALGPSLNKKDIDIVNIREEFGDIMWYLAIGIDETGGDFNAVMETVIAKLRARFPDKFTNDNAINRDLIKERLILEGK